jgi:serpin B
MEQKHRTWVVIIAGILLGAACIFAAIQLLPPAVPVSPSGPAQPSPVDTSGTTTADTMIAANNRFAFDLYHALAGKSEYANKNIFFSPSSISAAFAITAEGARSKTYDEMKSVFYLPSNPTVQREGSSRIYEALSAPGAAYTLSTANNLYAEKTYSFLPVYISTAQKYYHANVSSLDFIGHPEESRQIINRAVEAQTRDRIQDLIPAGAIDPATRLVIANAIYFKGNWEMAFDKNFTVDASFTRADRKQVNIPMMKQTAEDAWFPYTETATYQAIALPYKSTGGRPLSMLVILPTESTPDEFEKGLGPESLAGIRRNLTTQRVKVFLPRFTMDTSYDLKGVLPGMGMPTAFGMKADFSGMDGTKDLFIGDAFHKAFVEVNEEGTEAAAATAAVLQLKGWDDTPVFYPDHPFIFMIMDTESGNILFIGRVADPS